MAPAVTSCPTSGPLPMREDCLARLASGGNLAAQNALFALALLARDEKRDGQSAISFFRSYLGRFPDTPLAPEASLGALAELRALHRDQEAMSEADRYLSHYAAAGRADEVELLRASLLQDGLGRPAEALSAYERVLATSGRPRLRDEADFGRALALQALGRGTEAVRALERYRQTYPSGAHAAEAAALLRGKSQ